jgi:hypothetical protein
MASSKKRKCILKWIMFEELEDDFLLDKIFEPKKPISQIFQKRPDEGFFKNLITTHLRSNDEQFINFFRLSKAEFDWVLSLVSSDLEKFPSNRHQQPISPEEKLALTLR